MNKAKNRRLNFYNDVLLNIYLTSGAKRVGLTKNLILKLLSPC